MIFRRWYERGIPLLLDLQIASTEPVFIKGTITHLNSADLLFSGSALSVTVNFAQMDFEYEELAIGKNSTVSYMPISRLQLESPPTSDELVTPKITVSLSEI